MAKIGFAHNSNIIIIDVVLSKMPRQRRVRMAIDTGATHVLIPWEVAESLGLKPEVSRERIEIITASGIEKVPVVDIPLIKVGSSEAKNVKAMVHDLPPKSYVDGLLGLSFLKKFNLNINFKEGFFELK